MTPTSDHSSPESRETAAEQLSHLAADREQLLRNLATGQQDVATEKQRRAAAERELKRALQRSRELARQLDHVHGSAEMTIGRAVMDARRSPKAALRLPATVVGARHRPRAVTTKKSSVSTPTKPEKVQPSLGRRAARERTHALTELGASYRSVLERDGGLRIAGVVDDFTRKDLSHECAYVDVDPEAWREQLEAFRPNLLFVESAWRGQEDKWYGAVARLAPELLAVIEWCRSQGVPTVFWAKEDPIHMHSFLRAAHEFDYVYTTDIDCVGRYKKILGHDRVSLLPFANQPRAHAPIETQERSTGLVFAGSYYRRFPERTRDLESIYRAVSAEFPFDIYDRNFGLGRMEFAFPPELLPHVLGTLPPEKVELAYKGYDFSLNLNTIKQSQSMFARRVYELLASNTLVVSNYSRGMVNFFGDLVIASDSGEECVEAMRELYADPWRADALRLAGLRKVMREHTYADRLRYITSRITGEEFTTWCPEVTVVAATQTQAESDLVLAAAARQDGVSVRLVIVGPAPSREADGVVVETRDPGAPLDAATLASPGTTAVAFFDAADWYGPHYLLDLALTWRYADPDAVGKDRHATVTESGVSFTDGLTYREVGSLTPRRAAIAPGALDVVPADDLAGWIRSGSIAGETTLAVDSLGYCAGGAGLAPDALEQVRDIELDPGTELAELLASAKAIPAARTTAELEGDVTGAHLHGRIRVPRGQKGVATRATRQGVELASTLAPGERGSVLIDDALLVLEHWPAGQLEAHLEANAGLSMRLTCTFLDHEGRPIATRTTIANKDVELQIPTGTVRVQFGVQVTGPGHATIHGLLTRRATPVPPVHVPRARTLVVADQYPTHDDLYSNGFVHTRVQAYRERGLPAEVFALRPREDLTFGSFAGVPTMRGNRTDLARVVASNAYERVLVHFLTPGAWSALKKLPETTPVVVWIHGYEIQPWWRRDYGDQTPEQLEKQKAASDRRLAFWRKVLAERTPNVHFVFVSQHFAEEVMEDLGVPFPADSYSVIHNPIDTELFAYEPKSAEDRLRILSVRPYASAKYANDLTADAILELSHEPWFEDLSFTLIGDGPLFDPVNDRLRHLPNVTLVKRFLPQSEIAERHRDHGVFLVPTRMDAQGVSRDEAMASGLVPVTNAVAAVPEFVDDACGFLAPPEDAAALADAVRTMHRDPELFLAKSAAAAARVRSQSALPQVVDAELALMTKKAPDVAPQH